MKLDTLLVPLLLSTPLALAHHSATVHYDQGAEITHENITVKAWSFTNPHARLVFEAPHSLTGEMVEWTSQSTNVNSLARKGYHAEYFAPGEVVTVIGNPSRDGRPDMDTRRIIRADGRVVDFLERAENAPPPAALVSASYDDARDFSGVWENTGDPIPEEVIAELVPEDAFFWIASTQGEVQTDTERSRGEIRGLPLTEEGLAFFEQWTPAYDECRPTSGWMGQSAPFLHELDKPRGGRLQIRTEYQDQERTIWLDGRTHPPLDRAPRTIQGHSSGHWDGDTLVVETVHMLPNQITRNGVYHSENAVMTERIFRDGDLITWLRVLEDPDYLTQRIASILQYRRAPYPEVLPYGTCTLQQQDAR